MSNFFSLRNKGIAFILLPLVVQLIFVYLLTVFLNQEQQAATAEAKAKNAILYALKVNKSLTSTFLAANIYESSKGEFGQNINDEAVKKIESSINELVNLVSHHKYQNENLRELENRLKLTLEKFSILSKTPKGKKKRLVERKAVESVPYLLKSIKSVVLTEVLNATDTKVRLQKRSQVRLTILGSLAVNFLLLIFLPIAFGKSVLDRLSSLSRKTRRFSLREDLGEPDKGRDEIASLDRFLHRADKEISKTLENEKSTITNSSDSIAVADEEGIILQVNPATKRFTGIKGDDLLSKAIFDLADSKDILELEDKVSQIIQGKSIPAFEMKVKLSSGDLVDALWSVYYNNTENSLFLVLHDLSEEKEVERLKEDFVASISHDLRTPLTSIENAISLALLGALGELDDDARIELEVAQRNATRLIKLINDLLDFEKLKSGRMTIVLKRIYLPDLVAESIESLKGLLHESKVTVITEGIEYYVNADKDRILQVLVNLLSNAIKYSPAGSEVLVTARIIDRNIQILVVDNGPGVPDEMQKKIFKAYEQVDIKRDIEKKGTGLGLAIAAFIVREHGGDIGVFSQLGLGSTFWFTFPQASKID